MGEGSVELATYCVQLEFVIASEAKQSSELNT
jgi:hypothetical protein